MSTPVRPGSNSFIASSTPRVTSSVLVSGNFSTTSNSAGSPSMKASPMIRRMAFHNVGDVAQAEGCAVNGYIGEIVWR